MPPAHRAHLPDIFHRDRLPAAGVVGYGEHYERHTLAARVLNQIFQRLNIHVALEGMDRSRLLALGDDQIHCLSSDKLNVRASRVEVRVVGDHIALLAHHAEQDALGGTALMSRDDMAVSEDVLDRVAEANEALAPGVALVAFHDGRPLMGGHGAGARVRKQVDQHVVRG